MHITVVGRGVVGLTTACELLDDGHDVTAVGAEPAARTTSAVAAALWYPYRALPKERVGRWGSVSLARFRSLAADPDAGVMLRRGVEIAADENVPWWAEDVLPVDPSPSHLPWAAIAWGFEAPVIEMPLFLSWLEERVLAGGGRLEMQTLGSLEEAAGDAVVNCTGLASRRLVGDEELYPVRGQVVVVENPGIDTFYLDQCSPRGLTYIVPRSHDCVLGGTDLQGVWDTEPDEAAARAILERCTEVEPRLGGARATDQKVGLRPARPSVRVERAELKDGRTCVHNYGHGGAGVTLSWGCAREVAGILSRPS